MTDVKLPPIPTEWIGMLGARMVTHEEAQAYARQAVLEDRKRRAPPDYWKTPVQELGLGVRELNALLADRIYTVGDIYEVKGGILMLANVGKRHAEIISAALVARGWPPVYECASAIRGLGKGN